MPEMCLSKLERVTHQASHSFKRTEPKPSVPFFCGHLQNAALVLFGHGFMRVTGHRPISFVLADSKGHAAQTYGT